MECPACHTPNNDGARFCAKCGALLPASPTEEADPLIGAVVGGRFRITGVLGEGGMGRVYTGEQQMGTSVRKVAVKTLLSQYARDPQVLARFMRECGTVSELEHPNTIKVYDFGQTNTGELYIAMELLSGKSLEAALERGALPPERVDRILGQVCGSLEEAHNKGIVHRDLKPANIYLSTRAGEDDYVKVLDFGIAKKDDKNSKAEQKLTQQGTVLGTPPYMSPEQFKGHELDARSDIYSLAVMTYEMLTGRLPFDADTPWAWATQHMTAQPFPFEMIPLGSAIPPKMKAAVMRALAKDKAHRQQTVREFYEELTLGALRVSGLGPRSSLPEGASSSGGGAFMQGRPGGGQTQVGEPMFAGGPVPGRTMPDTGNLPAYPGVMPTNQGYAPAHHVPTGSGQVFAPPPMAPKKSSAGLIIAVIALALISAVVVVVVVLRPQDSISTSGDAGITPPPTTVVVANPTPSETAGGPTTGTGPRPVGNTSGGGIRPPVTTPPVTPTTATPPVDAKGDEECKAATRLASGNNVSLAVSHYRNCDGPAKASARSAIDQAAQRLAKNCSAVREANAAAQIGATTALNMLRAKNCPGVR
jgi:eukaryotic-like serine/threonine-protein kinase